MNEWLMFVLMGINYLRNCNYGYKFEKSICFIKKWVIFDRLVGLICYIRKVLESYKLFYRSDFLVEVRVEVFLFGV